MRLNVTELFIVSKIFLLIRFVTEKQSKKNKLFKVILDLSEKCIPNAALLGF
jgi:hypothetical protein